MSGCAESLLFFRARMRIGPDSPAQIYYNWLVGAVDYAVHYWRNRAFRDYMPRPLAFINLTAVYS